MTRSWWRYEVALAGDVGFKVVNDEALVAEGQTQLALRCPYSPRVVAACKAVPGMRWDHDGRAWRGYVDGWNEVRDRLALEGIALDVRDDAFAGHVWVPQECMQGLRDYQHAGVVYLYDNSASGCILADVMGAGKTAQAIRAARALSQRGNSTVVVCPSYVRGVWKRELEKWWPEARVEIRDGVKGVGPLKCDPYYPDVVIVHYDIVHAHFDRIVPIPGLCTLILDECHYIASEKSRRSKAVRELSLMASHRIGLSGTPMTNRPRDLWNVVDTLCPGRFGPFFAFALAYCGAVQQVVGAGPGARTVWNFDGASRQDELKRRLDTFMLRRTFKDIALELPPLTRQVIELKVPTAARVMPVRGANAAEMRRALDLASDAKLKEVVTMVCRHIDDGHVPVVFCRRRAVAEHMAASIGAACLIHGGVSPTKREEAIAAARADAKPLVATIDVASVGIDLTFADVAVFAEVTWEPWELRQAEARLFRFGQQRPVLVQYPIALGTGEELIRDVVIAKMAVESGLGLGEGDGLGSALSGGPDAEREALEDLFNAL